MKTSFISLICLAAVAAAVPATEVTERSVSIDERSTQVMSYSGPITPGGPDVQLEGSAESIYAQILELNPTYNPVDFGLPALNDTSAPEVSEMQKRSKSTQLCWVFGSKGAGNGAESSRLAEGIRYLKSLPGGCGVAARSCVRISCSWAAAIWLCNDNNGRIAPNCAYLASYAQDTSNACSHHIPGTGWYIDGQKFDTDKYNVIVRRDTSNGCGGL